MSSAKISQECEPQCLETYFLLGLEDLVPGRRTAFWEAWRFLCPSHLGSSWGHNLSGGARGCPAGAPGACHVHLGAPGGEFFAFVLIFNLRD